VDPVAVVIPTRNRPGKLEKCLDALAAAQAHGPFPVYVGDSSTSEGTRREIQDLCARYDFVRLRQHSRAGFGPARNFCASVAEAQLLVSVDDDVYVEPDAVSVLREAHAGTRAPTAIAGSVAWGEAWSTPVTMRWIGYGRPSRDGEDPDFLITALIAIPRAVALAAPWNERIRSSEDRFAGALWRARGVKLRYAPRARARHDEEQVSGLGGVEHQDAHIYTNLFDALMVRNSALRALSYEALGFAAGLKRYGRDPRTLGRYVAAWARGHRDLVRDWRYLRELVAGPPIQTTDG
jgi:glycosyltransferase involved in cell wall biosynthesis